MKRILVPTDFSPQAENALKVAVQLAKKFDAEIYLMNMLELPLDLVSSSVTSSNNQEGEQLPESLFFMRLAHKRFEELLGQDYLKGVKITDTVEFRSAFDGIIEGVKKYDADLIVMGSNGATGMKEVFVGSNTEKVVRHAERPVLVVKKEIENFEVNDFVFATDFVAKGKDAFWRALKFAALFGAKIHLVYINTANKFKTTQEIGVKMKAFTQDAPSDNFSLEVYNDSSIEKGILNYSKQIDAQLMGIATNGRRGLAHLLNGSISEDLVNHAQKPVVTFRV